MVNDYITRTKKKKENQRGDCEVTKNNWSSSQAAIKILKAVSM